MNMDFSEADYIKICKFIAKKLASIGFKFYYKPGYVSVDIHMTKSGCNTAKEYYDMMHNFAISHSPRSYWYRSVEELLVQADLDANT